ncbi:MAG: hypothetical protein LKF15_04190 [Lachnospiraceae bacterium]|nr:hypothetical protein [Lachnospiraceae bacterium]MCH4028156.1 hypothetical protein [Lachnospiraceae bacterium]MCH4066001.1 hypothetical protein [Lachnospiraceae bacterium]MCH4112036.1 hypothetical protein [Lachnospiraceae bacterium]
MLWNKKETTKWKTYQGEVMAVIRSKENAGSITVRYTSEGLEPAEVKIRTI